MLSNKPLMSPSMAQENPLLFCTTCLRAVWQLRPGLNPCEWLENIGSYITSSIVRTTSCMILSVIGGIPSGLILSLALGMYSLFVVPNSYFPPVNSSFSDISFSKVVPSIVARSKLAVFDPFDLLSFT